MVPLALFDFQALDKWGRQDEEKRLTILIACVGSLPELCLEKEHKAAYALTSQSSWVPGSLGDGLTK